MAAATEGHQRIDRALAGSIQERIPLSGKRSRHVFGLGRGWRKYPQYPLEKQEALLAHHDHARWIAEAGSFSIYIDVLWIKSYKLAWLNVFLADDVAHNNGTVSDTSVFACTPALHVIDCRLAKQWWATDDVNLLNISAAFESGNHDHHSCGVCNACDRWIDRWHAIGDGVQVAGARLRTCICRKSESQQEDLHGRTLIVFVSVLPDLTAV